MTEHVEIERVEAAGARAVEETWQRFVPTARLQSGDVDAARLQWASAAVAGMSVVTYNLHGDVQSRVDPADQIMACRVVGSDLRVGTPQRMLKPGSPWLASAASVRAQWAGDGHVRALVFSLDDAQHLARQISGDDRLVLGRGVVAALTPAAGRYWESVHRHVMEGLVLGADAGTASGILTRQLTRHAVEASLSAFPTAFLDAASRTAQSRPAPATVRRAIAHMESHLGEAMTVDDVALAAGISTRGLQAAFHRALGVSPTAYLRTARLGAAHEELRRGSGTVGEIARRWGFPSASRFAAQYREAYGRRPSDTLAHG